jgi:membrane-associated phospholipid phosphatase
MKISQKLNHSIRLKLLLCIPLFFLLMFVFMQYETICDFGGSLIQPTSLKTGIDAWIPFNIYIVYPYVLCLLYVPFSGILYIFNRRISAVEITSFYLSAILIWISCYAMYLVFPTTAAEVMISSPNPEILNLGMFQAIQSLYTSSTPLGDFPSLHVAPLVFMGLFLFTRWRSLFWVFLPFAFLGAIGTVLLKFHTFVGFLGGGVVGVFGYYVLYEKITLPYLHAFFLSRKKGKQ